MMTLLLAPAVAVPAPPAGCNLAFSTAYIYQAPTGTPNGKRAYLYHGLGGDWSFWDLTPPNELVASLRAAGTDIVLVNLPLTQACFFTNGGWQYRSGFRDQTNAIMNAVEAAHGTVSKNVIAGISFGGLHALMGAVITGRFYGWAAQKPVVRVDALEEYPNVGDAVRFNPQFEATALKDTHGFLLYGTNDYRVNWQLARDLGNQLGENVTVVERPGADHGSTSPDMAAIAAWVAAL